MEPGQSSLISPWRSAALVFAGGIAVYSAWQAYSIWTAPRAGLHRSNAIRRPHHTAADRSNAATSRNDRDATSLTDRPILQTAEVNLSNDLVLRIPLGEVDTFPTTDTFRTEYGLQPAEVEEAMSRFEDTVIELWIQLRHRTDPRAESVHSWLENREVAASRVLRAVENQIREGRIDVNGGIDGTIDEDAQTDLFETPNEIPSDGSRRFQDGHNLKSLLYYIAEDQARSEGYVHRGVTCNSCDAKPIRGIRWRCANCADYDLCSDCEAMGLHPKTHIFYKVRIPAPFLGNPRQAQPVLYPGRPHLLPRLLPSQLRRQLMKETRYEQSEMDALWDQFTSLANFTLPTENDPHSLSAAIDRKAFDKAFVPHSAISPPAPNLIYDRMFSFYDTNGDNLIDFAEFVKGLAILHHRVHCNRNKIVFDGYDIDGDGLVGRTDFLRMFRAYYTIQKEITRDLIAVQEEEFTSIGAQDTIMSSQPVNSAFTDAPISSGNRHRENTKRHGNGDIDLDERATRPDGNDTGDRGVVVREARDGRNRPLIRSRVSGHDRLIDRWRRRRFYTDVEEGWDGPEGYTSEEDQADDDDDEGLHTPGSEGIRAMSPRSRSSSKVRFTDDFDIETRSVTSTSSRPAGERWGGYEIPDSEKDIGREILYQVTQQGFNELLDPLFKDKEDLAVEAKFTKPARRHWSTHIHSFLAEEGSEFAVKEERRSGISFLPDAYEDKSVFFEKEDSSSHTSYLSMLSSQGYVTPENSEEALRQLSRILDDFLHEDIERDSRYGMLKVERFCSAFHVPWDFKNPLYDELINICEGRGFGSTGIKPSASVVTEAHEELSIKMGTLDDLLRKSGYTIDEDREAEEEAEAEGTQGEPSSQALDTPSKDPSPTPEANGDLEEVKEPSPPRSPSPDIDMTWPQFRPNNQADLERMLAQESVQANHPAPRIEVNGATHSPEKAKPTPSRLSGRNRSSSHYPVLVTVGSPQSPSFKHNPWGLPAEPPNRRVLVRLAMLHLESQQNKDRGRDGQINFEEFEEVMRQKEKELGFVSQWIEIGSF